MIADPTLNPHHRALDAQNPASGTVMDFEDRDGDIAVVGMSCRLPGARSVAEFWSNLCAGVESVSRFSDQEMLEAGIHPDRLRDPGYVRAHGALADAYAFDAAFFGVSGREAQVMDPQHRVFLECAWSALEDAGYDPARYPDAIGVYAGSGFSMHQARVMANPEVMAAVGGELPTFGNGKDFLTTRVSYKLGLRGPSVVVQTACSTSLVAIHTACQSLLNRECDMALAGGVTIAVDQVQGYRYLDGGILSPDGRCRAFDANAAGTVGSSGAGVVVLKRFADAARDGDNVLAVVKGSALNNDGAAKVGFTAPSVTGQAQAIAEALAVAGLDPADISYVEAHGTGTALGDPIEIAALSEVFAGVPAGSCALGAAKTNIGHTDTASGVAGFIKTVLALKHRTIPPTLHFERANPETGLDGSPFQVVTELRPWESDAPRRAGVSSFGMGGTNAHVVLEEAPELPRPVAPDAAQLLVLSAKTEAALEQMRGQLAEHLEKNPGTPLADVAWTLQEGRAAHAHRWAAAARGVDQAREALAAPGRRGRRAAERRHPVAFLFPGQGSQYAGMARELYEREPVFRAEIDRCATALTAELGTDLRTLLFPAAGEHDEAQARLEQTRFTQPALFTVEYALATLWMSWGVQPESMLGHSIGEYVAATLAGVFTLENALRLVAARGRLMQELPGGAMVAVPLPEAEVRELISAGVAVAAVNTRGNVVLAGEGAEMDSVEAVLTERGVATRRLRTSHAFHSAAMEPILDAFAAEVRRACPAAPRIPFLSNVTGDWITPAQATDAGYWVRHLRGTVRFADGVGRLLDDAGRVLLEVGPGESLGTFARRHEAGAGRVVVRSLPRGGENAASDVALLDAAGALWTAGVDVSWDRVRGGYTGARVPLPTYPFAREVHRVPPVPAVRTVPAAAQPAAEAQAPHGAEAVPMPAGAAPADAVAPAVTAETTVHVYAPEPAPLDMLDGDVEMVQRIVAQQLALMKKQLELLRDHAADAMPLEQPLLLPPAVEAPAYEAEAQGPAAASAPADAFAVPAAPRVAVTVAEDGTRTVAVTPAQRQIWVHSQLGDDASRAYNEQAVIGLRGELDAGALRAALEDLAAHHDALRTVFDPAGDVQHILPAISVSLAFRTIDDTTEALAAAVREAAAGVFDLEKGSLFRVHVHSRGQDRHVVQLVVHHIVADGLGLATVRRDLEAAFRARREGRKPELPQVMQFGEFAELLANYAETHADREAEWLARFRGAAPLMLPADRPRPVFPTRRAGRAQQTIPAELANQLRDVSRRQGCTLFMTMLGGLLATLHRVTGQDDMVVGIPSAGRPFPGSGSMVGHCVDVLPVRSQAADGQATLAFLKQVRGWLLDAYENEVFSYARLTEKLRIARGPGIPPLISVVFNLEPGAKPAPAGVKREAPKFGGLAMESVPGAAVQFAKFDIGVDAVDTGAEIELICQFDLDLFDQATVERMLGQLHRVLEQVGERTERTLGALDLLSGAERERVAVEWNQSAAEYPAGAVHELLEAQAARTPDAVAVSFRGETLTFAQLNAAANQLARHLVGRGGRPEARVGLALEAGLDTVVAVLAVMKSGGAYIPLDPGAPAERRDYILADAGVELLVTRSTLVNVLAGVEVLAIDAAAAQIAEEDASNLELDVAPESLAYVIYTSGSTGKPKGVAVSHGAIANHLMGAVDAFTFEPRDVGSVQASYAFDMWLVEVFGPMLAGGSARLLSPGELLEPATVHAALQGVTVLHAVPGVLRQLLDADRAHGGGTLRSLRRVFTGGDRVPAELLAETRAALAADAEMRVLYGPTETTVVCTGWLVPRDGVAAGSPIGSPLPNLRAYVCGTAGDLLPAGVAGELWIAGEGVARGYLGRPALTAASFIPDAFSGVPGARLYRTGDRVRRRADGTLEFLGRLDEQVKIRGFRIELGEIEAKLREHEGVRACAVLAREDVPGDRRLVAYVTGSVDVDALRAHLRRALPEYMVPAAFVALDEMPLNANGKVDRRALPAPDYASEAERYVAARNEAEEKIAAIWGEVLRLERVSVTESFFQLGGHSLLATRVVSRMREAFGVELTVRDLFERPTVAELAERVEALGSADAPVTADIVPVDRTGALPLSFAQERLWFLDRMQPGSAVYNIPLALRLRGALDAAAMERALGEIVRRHEALRTVFAQAGETAVQVVAPFTGFNLPVIEVSEAEVTRMASEDAAAPFDLSAGPLMRASLLRVSGEDHVLLINLHHIVSDGWSMGVLFRELNALYAAFRDGRGSPLAELAVQYADFAVWQREQLQGEALDRQLAWWKQSLAGAPALLELPADHARPAVQTYNGAHERFRLSTALMQRLEAVARDGDATLYMVLLAAFGVLLGKYAGTDDVVVGSPIAGRSRREVEPMIGFFVNTLALRTDLSGDPSFRALLARVRQTTLGAYEHQDVPFEKLVEELQPERAMSYSPLFQVMFTLQTAAEQGGAPGIAGLAAGGVEAEIDTAKFDLTLGMEAGPRGLSGALVFNTDLFERGTITGMIAHLERVLRQVANDADVHLSRVELVDAMERRRVVEEWNRTAVALPAGGIPQLFAEQAARTPHVVALVCEDESLTYAELDARANRVARHLRSLGVGPETRVGLCMQRGVEMVVALLGILKAGGAYVPLDPGYPAERLAYMQADSGIAVLLTQDSLRDALPQADGVAVVSMDGDRAAIEAQGADAIDSGAGPDTLAYVIYTSGSTGTPKGAGVAHRSVVRLVRGASFAKLDAEQVVLQAAPVAFDASTLELWGPLLNGGRLVLMPGVNPSLAELGAALTRHGVTTLWLTSGLFQVMVDERLDDLRTVRQLLAGGDVLPVEQVMKVQARFPACQVINGYGPTENTTFTTCYPVPAGWSGGAIPIGAPISNTTVYVVDAALRPVPVGVPGELYTGGEGVARGYLGRPAMTAERFVPDPFGTPGSRMYRTGDRVRWNASGVVEYLGRIDQQVKVRGFRIELGEIETRIRQHADVRECVVVAREDATGDRRLVAYVIGRADAEALRAHVGETLPDYMTPAAFVSLDALPLNPNGKVDRQALPAPEYAGAEDAFVAPRTPAEEVLAGIWAEVLRVERVGARDSFFALGGHSLLATRVVSRIREVFGAELPLRALFEGPTVAELAERVEQARGAGAVALPPVVPVQRTDGMPLSFAQERLWFIDRMQPESASYNVPAALRLRGSMDAGALRRALGEIVRRHEALRTTFQDRDGTPVQVISPFAGFELPVEELSTLAAEEREAQVRLRATEDAARPFDLTAGPLLRASLLRLADEEHVLLMCMHHIVSDGWSMGVLFGEMNALYAAFAAGEDSPLPELPVQYADFAAWQRTQLQGEALDRQLGWWKNHLAGAPALLELPTDRPRPAVQSYRGAHQPVHFSAEVLQGLQALAREEGATLYMVVLAAFQLLLSRYSGMDDVVVGSPIAGRTRREVEELIGFFVNTLVLRTDVSGDPTFRELLARVRATTLGAYEHQDVPFEKLVAEVQPERSLSHSPLFQVMFTLQNLGGTGGGLPGLRTEGVGAELATTKHDLALTLAAAESGLHGSVAYSTDLFDAATIHRMLGHLEQVLRQVAEKADARLSALELLTPAERETVVAEWNRNAEPFPAHACIHTLFQEQALRTPGAVAAVCENDSLTYAELDARASRLASHLAALGAGPEVRVGICLQRGLELLVSMLAVLKAGAAYVPLDPAYPAERLKLILADAGVAALVTEDSLRGLLPVEPGVHVVRVDADAAAIAEAAAAPPAEVGPRDLAYLIYTSGSTGRPKGVAIEHQSAVAMLSWAAGVFSMDDLQGVLACTSICFDLSVFELFLPLTRGGRVIVVENALALATTAAADQVRLLNTVPSAAAALVRTGGIPAGVRTVNLAGEPLKTELVDALYALGTVRQVYDLYGPSEDTTYSTFTLRRAGARATIGRAIANSQAYVLDASLQPVPVGVVGELYLGGRGVARGYLGRPSLTAERFVPDHLGGEPGARLYRTGDKVRWTPAGELEYLGRLDEQVKIRGFRIELGEIDAGLRAHSGVRDCAVVAREMGAGDRRLVAYVVGRADAETLRAHLRQSLPEYMVPSAFVALDALPLTPNGKLDRKALPAPSNDGAGLELDEPRTFLEARLIQIWEELLGLSLIAPTQSFFELGGNSLLALRLLSLIESRLQVALPVATLFAAPTVREMAIAIHELRRAPAAAQSPLVPLQPGGSLPPLFIVHPADRSVMGYVNIVRHLGAEQPVFGLQDVSDDLARPLARVAAEYVEAVRSAQPEGPYHLAGWSFGGFVAYEMAVQLERAGQEVRFLGLLDSMSPRVAQAWPWNTDADLVAALAADISSRRGRPSPVTPDELRGMEFEEQVRAAAGALRDQGSVPADFADATLRAQCQVVRDRLSALDGYQPGTCTGTLTLFRAEDVPEQVQAFHATYGEQEERTLGWSAVSPNSVVVHPVPGTHASITGEPHVRVLVERMRESLRAAHGAREVRG